MSDSKNEAVKIRTPLDRMIAFAYPFTIIGSIMASVCMWLARYYR